jgi:hypothetical protein
MRRKLPKQELIAGAVGINTKREFVEKLFVVLETANGGLNSLRRMAVIDEVDEIAEWSGLSRENVCEEAEKLRETVQRLYSRAFRHYLALRESADKAPDEPPDMWCARKGQAALKLNDGIVTCLENVPLGVGKEIAQQLRAKLIDGGEEALLTAAAAMLLDAKTDVFLD